MAILFALLAAGLLGAAWINRRQRGVAAFFLVCALLNAAALANVLIKTPDQALQLQDH